MEREGSGFGSNMKEFPWIINCSCCNLNGCEVNFLSTCHIPYGWHSI